MSENRFFSAPPVLAPDTAPGGAVRAAPSLPEAYAFCSRLARRHYENFPVGSWLLPRRLRPSVHAVYAFARGADDFADEPWHALSRLQSLDRWQAMLEEAARGRADHPVFVALSDTLRRHRLPLKPFHDLLTAFRMDARGARFETWEDLLAYCRCSANPVGRLLLRLFGYDDPELDALSDPLCTALQLTNFWQDLGTDLRRGRVYLPEKDLRDLGILKSNLLKRRGGGLARGLVGLQVERTRALYDAARPLPGRLAPPLSWEVRAIAAGGLRILQRVESEGLDPLSERPRLSWLERAAIVCQALLARRGEAPP
jgi:phytoene synthase